MDERRRPCAAPPPAADETVQKQKASNRVGGALIHPAG